MAMSPVDIISASRMGPRSDRRPTSRRLMVSVTTGDKPPGASALPGTGGSAAWRHPRRVSCHFPPPKGRLEGQKWQHAKVAHRRARDASAKTPELPLLAPE